MARTFLRRSGMLLTQLGMSHLHSNLAVDALSKLRAGSTKGEHWNYEFLLIDIASVGAATIALVRNIRRDPSLDQLRIVISGSHEAVQDLGADERIAVVSANCDERELRETLSRLSASVMSNPSRGPRCVPRWRHTILRYPVAIPEGRARWTRQPCQPSWAGLSMLGIEVERG